MKIKNIIISIVLVLFTGCATNNYTSNGVSKSYKVKTSTTMIGQNTNTNPQTNKKSIFIDTPISTLIKQKPIAIVVPTSTIGRYAIEAINSINTYMLYRKKPFFVKVYDLKTQSRSNIIKIFDQLKQDNVKKAIVMTTKDTLGTISKIDGIENIKIYFPLVYKDEISSSVNISNMDVAFGAISYKDQFEALVKYANSNKLVDFYDNSSLGSMLHRYLKKYDIKYAKRINDNNSRYKRFIKNSSRLSQSTLFLNTPIVKSSILLSTIAGTQHLRLNKILSTQLNYSPLIFKLTQKLDRKLLTVASSIGKLPDGLAQYSDLMGTNITYSWVNYATIVGMEYLVYDNVDIFEDLKIVNKQVRYPVRLYKVGDNSFYLIKFY
jgi:uncharacterized protein YceK